MHGVTDPNRIKERVEIDDNAEKTHCNQGHPFDVANTYLDRNKYRVCRTCQRAAVARYKARKRQERQAVSA